MVFNKISYFLYDIAILTRVWMESTLINFSSNNDISKINDNIYIGNLSTSTNKKLLLENGITHVICIMSQPTSYFPKDFKYLNIHAYDIPEFDLTYTFPVSNTFIDNAVKENGKIYIHCMCGASRSVSIVLSYFLWKYPNISLEEHLSNIVDKRDKANPNSGFLKQLQEFNKINYEKIE